MNADEELSPTILKSSRRKSAATLIGSLAFIILGSWLLTFEGHAEKIVGVVNIVLFTLCALIGGVSIFRRSTLMIDASGVTHRGLLTTRFYPWHVIENIRVIRMQRTRFVGFDLGDTFKFPRVLIRLNRRLTGVDAGLPTGWQISPDALAKLLVDAQEHRRDPRVKPAVSSSG